MTPHLNHLIEMVQMRDHNISFSAELTKIIPYYHQILPIILSSAHIIFVSAMTSTINFTSPKEEFSETNNLLYFVI